MSSLKFQVTVKFIPSGYMDVTVARKNKKSPLIIGINGTMTIVLKPGTFGHINLGCGSELIIR